MNIIKAHNLACPIDGGRLEFQEKQLVCEKGHVFDVARQGYVNLLPVQHKRSKHPGDSKEMVLARTRFLNSGNYEAIANKLAEIVLSQIINRRIAVDQKTSDQKACLLDAGCGEGYYFDYIFNVLKDKKCTDKAACCDFSFIGLDISKAAIAEAAKRNKQITWIVGTNRQPPVEMASIDMVLCVFGFQSFEGFSSILKPGGKVILVEPGPDHLKELREIIYTEVKKTDPPDLSHMEKMGFSVVGNESLQFKTGTINNEQINNLLLMTPHFYRANKEGREAAANLQELDLTVDVVFRILEKVNKDSEIIN